MGARLKALLADSAPTRRAVRAALAGSVEICAEAEDRAGALSRARATRPDVCLIGRSLPGGAVAATREIVGALPPCAVVILADNQGNGDLLEALRAGAVGYLPASLTASDLRGAIRALEAAQPAIPRALVGELVAEVRGAARATEGRMTVRESEIVRLLRQGDPTARIAEKLAISPVTVRRHISTAMQKSGSSDRAELVHKLTATTRGP